MARLNAPMVRRQHIPLISLLAANAVSQLGSMLTIVALPWFVLQTTGSASKAGITLAVDTVPIVFAGLFGGMLVDWLGYRRSSIISDFASALMVGAIPLLYLTIGITFWQLLVLVFLGALVNQPGTTARSSLIPELADRAGMSLVRANSIVQAVRRLALLLGPPIAGVLITLIGASDVLLIDAISFVISASIVTVGVPRALAVMQKNEESRQGDTLAGLRHIARDRLLFWIVTVAAVESLISEPIYTIVYPVYARQVYSSSVVLGMMFSALAAGSLAGLALYSLVGTRLPNRVVLIGGFTAQAAGYWVMVALPSLAVLLGAIALSAAIFEPINPLVSSILQERTPAGLRGRVFGAFTAISIGTLPIGTLIGGFLLGGPGLVPTLAIISSACVVQVLCLPLVPAFRQMSSGIARVGFDQA